MDVGMDADGSGPKKVWELGEGWYFTREDIDRFSPSRKDGIDVKKEAYLRKSYCTFLKDIGMQLKLPQVTIATSIMFCHRFYLRQSHCTNDRYTVATACMFLAGKVEETPRSLRDVTMLAYEIRHKKDPASAERIKQKEFYEQQKELVLLAERVVLCTLAFDLNVQHPYKYLVTAIKIFKVAQNSLAQVAWNFVNDGLHTTLCLQFRPQHIAAGAIFLAAKFLKVKLPSDGERPWWQEFDVTPRQLEDVSNQMLELYEQTKSMAASTSNDIGSNQDTDNQLKVSDKDVSRGKSNCSRKYLEDAAEEGIPSRKHPDNDVLADHASNKPITYKQFNVKTVSDDIVGQESILSRCGNEGPAFPKPVTKWPPEVIQDSEWLASNLATVDTNGKEEVKKHANEVRNGERKGNPKFRMHSMDDSGAVSSADNAKGGYTEGQMRASIKPSSDLLEPKFLERTELGEERKRKRKSRWDDPSDECCAVSPSMLYDGSSRFVTGAHMNVQDSDLSNVTWIGEQIQPTGKIMLSKREKGSSGQWRSNKVDGKHGQNTNKEYYSGYPQQQQQIDNASYYCQQQQLMDNGTHYYHPQQQIVTEKLYEQQQGVNPGRI